MSSMHKSTALFLALVILLLGLPTVFARGARPGAMIVDQVSEGSLATVEVEVIMRNVAFQPEEITVAPGTTVIWRNADSFAHTVTSGTRGSATSMFDEDVPAGESLSFTTRGSPIPWGGVWPLGVQGGGSATA